MSYHRAGLVEINHPGLAPFAEDPRRRCKDIDPEFFFPTGSGPNVGAEAKAVCRRCPLVVDCQEWALTAPEGHGVWGAMSAAERRVERSRRLRLERSAAA